MVVLFFLDQFWSHPGGSASDLFRFLVFLSELEGESEVSYFDVSLLVDEDVVAFEVSVELFLSVDGGESCEYLFEDVGDNFFFYVFFVEFDEASEGSSVHVLDEHEDGVLEVVGEVVADDVA